MATVIHEYRPYETSGIGVADLTAMEVMTVQLAENKRSVCARAGKADVKERAR